MKLVFFCGAGIVSGKERQTLNMMIALQKRGHDIFCVMASWGTPEFEVLLSAAGIPFSKMRTGFISKTISWPAIRMTLHQFIYLPGLYMNYRTLIKTFRPDAVIHTNFHHIFLLLPVLAGAKQVFYVHDNFPATRFMLWLFKKFNRKIESFVGVSQFICNSLLTLGIDQGKIKRVYNGVPAQQSSGSIVEKSSTTIGIIGQIGEWKGHEVLLQSLSKLKALDWTADIIGTGDEAFIARLHSIIQGAGLESRVKFRGRVAELKDIYSNLDIVCVPSLIHESFGLVAAEAGSFGLPVVCSSLGALPEVIQHGQTGLVVPAADADALADALKQLILSPADRKRLGTQALDWVSRKFSITDTAADFEEVISQLVFGSARTIGQAIPGKR